MKYIVEWIDSTGKIHKTEPMSEFGCEIMLIAMGNRTAKIKPVIEMEVYEKN